MTRGIHQPALLSSSPRNQQQMNASMFEPRHTGRTNIGAVPVSVDAKKAIMCCPVVSPEGRGCNELAAKRLKNVLCVLVDLKLAAPECDSVCFLSCFGCIPCSLTVFAHLCCS